MAKIYYDKDADLTFLKNKTVGVIGYGIQGRAQALNVRDAGVNVIVANRKDAYRSQAKKDGFKIYSIDEIAKLSDVILFLIPDQAQKEVYNKCLQYSMKPGSMLVFAHGFALRYGTIKPRKDIDVAMLAPRMPGRQIRGAYLKKKGIPAFVDVVQDCTGHTLKKVLGLAKAAGFTRSGVLAVSYKVETELDLFIEQYLVAAIVSAVHTSFETLVKKYKYPAVPLLMELYASGELAEVLRVAAETGIGKVFQKNASPTCQFGIAENFSMALGKNAVKRVGEVIETIKDGSFAARLDKEGNRGYKAVKKLWGTVDSKELTQAQDWINKNFKWREG